MSLANFDKAVSSTALSTSRKGVKHFKDLREADEGDETPRKLTLFSQKCRRVLFIEQFL
ncbi:hypothetical protein HMPREF1557_01829 [Streptococcus sobrinus W1703]|uniref:Uncharacterized protein n=1 Tax=Streptococcus sobrinus W1703 TaxID=1227275 RepID=U2J2E4_9STRE|nr:hypothetical protein HMPREF1557_01829 [Streptococcus sobrinus W1703]